MNAFDQYLFRFQWTAREEILVTCGTVSSIQQERSSPWIGADHSFAIEVLYDQLAAARAFEEPQKTSPGNPLHHLTGDARFFSTVGYPGNRS